MAANHWLKLLLILTAITFNISFAFAQEQKSCALILLHGKWHNPRDFGFFGGKLEPTCSYKSIEMPWSSRRKYDEPYTAALADIKAQVEAFRQDGFKRVILVGHSFGANAALAYMAEVGDADAVISLAAGHSPAYMYQQGIGAGAVDKARSLVESGKGDETLSMDDLNQGRRQSISMRASVLLSYFDPNGLGNMPGTITRFKKPVPLLWVVGNKDPLFPFGPGYAFDKAPNHPSSKYVVVQADHVSTPDAAVSNVQDWIKALP
jgi:pimeloyl-ACP methyl ester carboxylesterase